MVQFSIHTSDSRVASFVLASCPDVLAAWTNIMHHFLSMRHCNARDVFIGTCPSRQYPCATVTPAMYSSGPVPLVDFLLLLVDFLSLLVDFINTTTMTTAIMMWLTTIITDLNYGLQ
jgi:hypothetical protein